ncbi:hypothetical protein CEXT_437331 [Caerostris extrusa]|uniref:C2H2-type domain-containing protein n=1 Tax=Caerostris extrusa TaxID=172846 RepID=A0AAV4S8Y9_CAEEX|nr:hypothetical protein CEXT_437331 [Caerostris extrusa]
MPFSCRECGKCFVFNSELVKATCTECTFWSKKPYKCGECGECGKFFADRSNLSTHVSSIHTGEKPYACNKCGKRYFRNFDLKRHLLRHAGEDRRKCDSCGADFSSEDSLTAHKCGKNKWCS